jgi:hypothetical protein
MIIAMAIVWDWRLKHGLVCVALAVAGVWVLWRMLR